MSALQSALNNVNNLNKDSIKKVDNKRILDDEGWLEGNDKG